MGSPYTSQSISNYNSSPPSDDGSQTASNQVLWSTIKSKLSDPINTFCSAVNSAVSTAFGKVAGGITAATTTYQVLSTDQGKTIYVTGSSATVTTPDATVVGTPFTFWVANDSGGDITLDGSGSQTIDGDATVTIPDGKGVKLDTDGSNWFTAGRGWVTSSLPRGYIDGCTLSNGTDTTNDIDIAAGICRDSTNAVDITCAAMTKQLDANWVAGTNQGFRDTAAGIANDTYHIYAVSTAAGTQDYYATTQTTAANALTALQAESGGSSYAYARYIGSIVRAAATILQFTQYGDTFILKTPVADVTNTADHTTAATGTLSSIPTDFSVEALIRAGVTSNSNGAGIGIHIFDVNNTGAAPPGTTSATSPGYSVQAAASNTSYWWQTMRVFTNTSSQIKYRADHAGVDTVIITLGWVSQRGKNL